MPGNFFNFNNNSNNNSSRRRKRSLLGRKNHSENDLPRQGEVVVLPENVKTVLLAGTPECWSLSSSNAATPGSQQDCDASLLSFASSSVDWDSPRTRTSISSSVLLEEEEEKPRHNTQEFHKTKKTQRQNFWPRFGPKGSLHKTFSEKETAPASDVGALIEERQQPEQQQNTVTTELNSAIVVNPPTTRISPSLPAPEALNMWLTSVDALLKSKEMNVFVHTTCDVVMIVGGIAVKTAFLPVTLPLHWANVTKDFVGQSCQQVVRVALQKQLTNEQITHSQSSSKATSIESRQHEDKIEGAVTLKNDNAENQSNPLGALLQIIGKIKDDIGSTVISLVTPPQPRQFTADKESDQEALDRLRLPVFDENGEEVEAPTPEPLPTRQRVTKADFTKYLMRIEDLGVTAPDNCNATVLYIDLSSEYGDRELLTKVLDQLATRAIDLTTEHAPPIPPDDQRPTSSPHVEWKPEGSTAKLIRKKARQTPERWEETLQKDLLVWSGTFRKKRGGAHIYRQYPMFLAKGVVSNLSPRAFLELFWNDGRTHEYNFYCMGRETMLGIDDEILSSKKVHTGTKVVKSETRVPFTSLSVTLLTMMHCRPLPGGPKEGYVIVSRSLQSGMAGYHTRGDKSAVQKSKSEILWGVNVLRSIPNRPDQTELTSLSQVASSMIPTFLSHKIGLMGVEDFFRSVRDPNPSKASSSSCDRMQSGDETMSKEVRS